MIEYDKEVIKILKISEQEAISLYHQYVSTEHIILAILKINNSLSSIFKSINLTYTNYKNMIETNINKDKTNKLISYTPLLKKIMISSINNNKIVLKNIVIKILEDSNSLATTLINLMGIDINKLYNLLKNDINIKYGINLNKNCIKEKLFYRDKELNELIEVLCRKNKNNAILLGEAGVGKTTLVELLAQKIENNEVPNELKNKEIISINMSSIVSGTRYRGEFEEKLEKIIDIFENNDKYILFIDEIHTILKAGASEGAIDAANIMKPYLARNKIKCIGATTIDEYNNTIKNDKALNRRFQTIYIKEPNHNETKKILLNSKKYYEEFHNVKIKNSLIENIINMSKKLLPEKKEPDRSLDILDKACTKLKLNNLKNKNIDSLIELKNQYIKDNNFNKAKLISKKIKSLKNNSIMLNRDIINSCFDNYKNYNNIGFKVK